MTAGATTIHTSLVAALTVADLVTTLSGTDEYTVFAPTDAAFAAAGIDLDSFTTDAEIAVLADILLYHVVAGTTMSGDLADGVNTVTAANGDTLDITVSSTGVTVGASNAAVTLADVPASNGVIHVIDAVLTPPADPVVDPFEGIDCAVTIGVGASGYAFTPDVVTIAVGETVCWSWEDESMPHNVKEITGYKSTNFVEGGVTSGAAASTVNFHHTFTEDTTFFYACEPHVALNMFGEVVVGDGGDDDDAASTVDSDDEENTPGFMVISTLIAVIGALALMGRTSRDE
jgi:plastocyanin